MNRDRLLLLVSHLLQDIATSTERNELLRFINSDDTSAVADKLWADVHEEINESARMQIWERLQNDIQPTHIERTKNNISVFKHTMRIAASIVILIGCCVGLYFAFNSKDSYEQLYSFNVKKGQKASMTLADGTIVWLNSSSKLTFGEDYNNENRTVCLTGEAFFEVAKNAEKKFIVECNGVEIEALGTQFNVKGYPSDSTITTTLSEGKVKVSTSTNAVVLTPNDVAIYNTKDGKLSKSMVDNLSVANFWMSDNIVFEAEALESIAKIIERMYDVDVVIRSERLKKIPFSGTIRNNSLRNVFQVISLTYPIKYTIDDNVIWIDEIKK